MNLADPLISDLDRKIIAITGYGKRRGFGKRSALMIIDAQNKFVGLMPLSWTPLLLIP